VGMAVEKIANPVVNTVWHLQLRELGHQCRVPDRVKRLRKVKREDVSEVILSQHCAHGVQHCHDGRRRRARRPERELIGEVKSRAWPQQRRIDVATNEYMTCRSSTRDRTGVIEIGRKSLACDGTAILAMGVITAVFHWRGTTPAASDSRCRSRWLRRGR